MNTPDRNIDAANRIVGKRVAPGSIKSYKEKINTIKVYLVTENLQHLIYDSGNIIVPLPDDIMRGLFGWLSKNTDLPKKKTKGLSYL